ENFFVNIFHEILDLALHLFHALAHLQDDGDAADVHAQVARQIKNKFEALQVVIGVEACVAFGAGRFKQSLAFVETQGLRVDAIHFSHRRDHICAFRSSFSQEILRYAQDFACRSRPQNGSTSQRRPRSYMRLLSGAWSLPKVYNNNDRGHSRLQSLCPFDLVGHTAVRSDLAGAQPAGLRTWFSRYATTPALTKMMPKASELIPSTCSV